MQDKDLVAEFIGFLRPQPIPTSGFVHLTKWESRIARWLPEFLWTKRVKAKVLGNRAAWDKIKGKSFQFKSPIPVANGEMEGT
jgi:hypothetical protein